MKQRQATFINENVDYTHWIGIAIVVVRNMGALL
jgi:hypothetical protein